MSYLHLKDWIADWNFAYLDEWWKDANDPLQLLREEDVRDWERSEDEDDWKDEHSEDSEDGYHEYSDDEEDAQGVDAFETYDEDDDAIQEHWTYVFEPWE